MRTSYYLHGNYRPINLTNASKVKVTVIMVTVTHNKLINSPQHGFRSLTNLLDFFHNIFVEYDEDKSVVVNISLVFKMSLYKIPHHM